MRRSCWGKGQDWRCLPRAGAAWAPGSRPRGSQSGLEGWVVLPPTWRAHWEGPRTLMLHPSGLFLWPHQIQTPHRGGSLSLSLTCHDPIPHPTHIPPGIHPSHRAPFCLLQEAFLPQCPPSTILGPGENSFFLEDWLLSPPHTQPKAP